MEEKFDVIIVGAGLAGNIAAYLLAKEGLEVILIERAEANNEKNVTGGRNVRLPKSVSPLLRKKVFRQ